MTGRSGHFRALERMYLGAPVNRFYAPEIEIGDGECDIRVTVREAFLHAAGAVHGSVLFKMLDDSAFFAANSLDTQHFVLTDGFTTWFLRPVSDGIITARGRVLHKGRTRFLAESVVTDSAGRELARGSGSFARGKLSLSSEVGYHLPVSP